MKKSACFQHIRVDFTMPNDADDTAPRRRPPPREADVIDVKTLHAARTQTGRTLGELSAVRPQLVVFLRHSGCTFCRQALADLARERAVIERSGTGVVLVHMQDESTAAALMASYGLSEVPRISDPQRTLYDAFQLHRGTMGQVAGPAVWWAGLKSLTAGHLPGIPAADVFQLPGAFLLFQGKILKAFRAETSAAHPDYCEMAQHGNNS